MPTDKLLAEYDSLAKDERTAWDAWFNGGNKNVSQFMNKPDDVHFGKAECQWVPFTEFWLKKLKELGWLDIKITKEGIAIGAAGKPKYIKYQLSVTEKGWDVREATLARCRERMADHSINY